MDFPFAHRENDDGKGPSPSGMNLLGPPEAGACFFVCSSPGKRKEKVAL